MSNRKDAAGCDVGRSRSPHSASQNITEHHQESEDGSLSFIPVERPAGVSPTDLAFNNIQGLKEAQDPAPQSFLGGASSSVSTAIDKSPNGGLDALISYFLTQPTPPAPCPSSGSFATHPTWGAIDHLGIYHLSSQSHGLLDVSGSSSVTAIGKVPLPGLLGSERRRRDDEAALSPTSSLMGTDGFEVHPYTNGSTLPSREVEYQHTYKSGQQLGSSQRCFKDPLIERHEAHSRRTSQSRATVASQTAYPRHNTRGGEVQLPRTIGANQHDIIARPPAPSPAHPRWIAENKIIALASAQTSSPSTPPSRSAEKQVQDGSNSSPRESSTSVHLGSRKMATSLSPEHHPTTVSANPTSSPTFASKKRKRGDCEGNLEAAQLRPSPSVKRDRPLRWTSTRSAPASSSSIRSPASKSS